jgi:hypothetical protein
VLRVLLIAPIALLVTAAIGWTIGAGTGAFDPHGRAMLTAGVIVLIGCAAGAVPLVLNRGADQAAVAQAGLVATMAHLFVAVALAAVVMLKWKPGMPFTWWLLTFYWTTLVGLVIATVRLVKSAPSPRAETAGATAAAIAKH